MKRSGCLGSATRARTCSSRASRVRRTRCELHGICAPATVVLAQYHSDIAAQSHTEASTHPQRSAMEELHRFHGVRGKISFFFSQTRIPSSGGKCHKCSHGWTHCAHGSPRLHLVHRTHALVPSQEKTKAGMLAAAKDVIGAQAMPITEEEMIANADVGAIRKVLCPLAISLPRTNSHSCDTSITTVTDRKNQHPDCLCFLRCAAFQHHGRRARAGWSFSRGLRRHQDRCWGTQTVTQTLAFITSSSILQTRGHRPLKVSNSRRDPLSTLRV